MFYHGISLSEIIVIVIDIVSSKPNKYCRAAQFAACAVQLNPNAAAKHPQTKSMRQKLTRKERFVHKFSDI